MKKILLMSHKMNLGGTEKALLSFINALNHYQEEVKITLLLLEKGGSLESSIPPFVEVKYFENFETIKPIIENPPINTISTYFKNLHILSGIQLICTYIMVKLTGDWHHFYRLVLQKHKQEGLFDVAIAFAGPSDFISYYIINNILAKKKIQWIHFDIEKVIHNFNFGKKYYTFFNKIFCVSNSSREIFLKHFPKLTSRTEVFHNIILKDDIFKQAELGSGFSDKFMGMKLLTVGRITKEKGHHLIPSTAKKLKYNNINFRWYIVGDGVERNNIEQLSRELGVSDYLVFLGEKNNPYPYMKNCDIYIQPSLHEGYGITVAEAKLFNKPIVITNFASAKDLIENNVTGLIADFNSESLFDNISKIIEDKSLALKFTINLSENNTQLNDTKQVERVFF